MKAVSIPGGWYLDSLPTGEYGCILPTQKQVQTNLTKLPYPADEPLWLAITNFPVFKMIGQGHAGTGTWEFLTPTGWHLLPASCGVWPVIYDLVGTYHIAQCAPPTGSQGYRYVAPNGNLVTGDATISVRNGLNEWTDLSVTQDGSILVGQGHEGEGACVWAKDALRLLHPGANYNIRAKYNVQFDIVSVSFYNVAPDGIEGWIYWMALSELVNLPVIKHSTEVEPFTHPVQIAPFMAANSGSPDIFTFGVYTESEHMPASVPPDKRMLLAHDGPTDYVLPAGMRKFDIPLIEYYRIPEETITQSATRWKRQTLKLLQDWPNDIGVISMFYTQNRWSITEVLEGISYLSRLVNLSPRIKLVAPFAYNRANGITASPELMDAFHSLQRATPGTPVLELIVPPTPEPPDPEPPDPEPPQPTPPQEDDMIAYSAPVPGFNPGDLVDNGNGTVSVKKTNGKFLCITPDGHVEERDTPGGAWESFRKGKASLIAERDGGAAGQKVFVLSLAE